jgi:hypothetical protein
MHRISISNKVLVLCSGLLVLSIALLPVRVEASSPEQQPSPNIPTVTGTATGPIGRTVLDQDEINVRSGPGTDVFPRIGVLQPGQDVPVLGRSPGGDWLLVYYPGVPGNKGWVYQAFVVLPLGTNLPIIEPPSTPTPAVTPTIDATLAARFITDVPPTRLPTYTPAQPITIPTFESGDQRSVYTDIPMGLPITVLLILGLIGGMISFLRG